ncbi:putative glutamyl-tRNA(Gln) amidotransferase subunit A, mitochondrial-like, partial [Capsicum annuum]
MAKISLSRLCKQEKDHELVEVRCKYGYVLPLMTSWTSRNSGRRYWTCPYYGNARSCDFWLWKDDSIDERSKFVIPKLLGRIGELEERVESSTNYAFYDHKIVDDKTTRTIKSVESKMAMNKIELQMDNFQDDLKMMKANEKK